MKDSVVTKLALRETRGSLQPYSRSNRVRFFKKCPQRFCLPLESILDVNGVIKKGHVILGFTKDGRYLISYCLRIDSDDSSPLPHYIYSLHWWQFNQHRPLVQVFTVTLFDKEEIHQDLYLMVAESQDESKFVVYGEIRSVKDDQSRQCYVTVCAAPSPRPCPGCQYTPLGGVTEKCLKHSFVVHFKYDLLPPFPIFNPSTSLKMKDTVVFNTGDFLMALTILTFDRYGSQLPECPQRSYSVLSEIENQISELSNNMCSSDTAGGNIACQCSTSGDTDRCSAEVASEEQVRSGKNITCHLASTETDSRKDSSSDANDKVIQAVSTVGQVHIENKRLDRNKIVSGFVSELNKIHSEQVQLHGVDENLSPSHQTANKKDYQDGHSAVGSSKASFPGNQTKERSDERKDFGNFDGLPKLTRDLSASNSIKNSEGFVGTSGSLDKTGTVALQSTFTVVAENSSSNIHNTTESLSCSSSESDMKVLDHNSNCDQEHHERVPHTGLPCSSCGCSMLVPTLSNNNLTSSIVKIYTETIAGSFNELSDVTDEFDMYDGSLPIAVKTCQGRILKQVGKINKSNPNPASNQLLRENLDSRMLHEQTLAVHQVTLDLEQCINELIQAHEGLRDSYKSLKDYDVQIVGVCPDSGKVIVMARILVYTRTRRQTSASCGLPVSPSPMLQCTGFVFSWDVCGGAMRILQALDLESYPEQKKYAKFNMAAKEASELRAKFFIPQSICSFVQAFSNHTVFTGKSLKYLRHPCLPLVLVL